MSRSPLNPKQTRWITRGLALFLLVCHLILALSIARSKAPTADEYSYISSGYLYVKTGDFRLDRTHPPLLRLLMGIPLQFLDIRQPPLQREKWSTDESYFLSYPIGWTMLLGGKNDWPSIVFWARLPIVLLSCLLAGLLFVWGRELYGDAGGLAVLFLYSFSPNMLAHASLATMDAGLCFFFMLALYLFYRYTQKATWLKLFLAGIGLGFALAAKVTALLLIPVFLAGLVWLNYKNNKTSITQVLLKSLYTSSFLFATAFVTLLFVYGYPLHPFYYPDTVANVFFKSLHTGTAGQSIPGMPHRNYAFYLMGHYSTHGWPYYFIIALLVKTPLALFFALGLVLLFSKKRFCGFSDGLLLGSLALLLLASAFNRVDIGIRHILPFYPLLFLYLGRIWELQPKAIRIAAFCFGLWFLGVSLLIFPNDLAYFNELAGGPSQGQEWLDDSNLDWGQDLNQLQTLQARYPNEPLYVATNWMLVPEAFGVQASPLKDEQIANPPKGLVAVGKHWAVRHRVNTNSPAYFDWLEKYKPIEELGHSIWVFRFSGSAKD